MTALRALLVTLLFAALAAAPAQAGIWAPYASGTTETITAVDYVAPGQLVYATAGGKIFKNGAQRLSAPGVSFNDLAMSPDGTKGIAVGSNATIYRSSNGGDTWTGPTSLANTTFNHSSPCSGSGGPYSRTAAPAGNLYAVAWSSNTVAWSVGADKGVVLQTTNGGNTWSDLSRQSDGSCFVNGGPLTDVATVVGTQLLWIVDDNFGARYISSNGLTSSASRQGSTAANCFDKRPRLALDTTNTSRSFVSDRCTGSLQWGFSQDGGVNYELSLHFVNGEANSLTGLNDTAIAGGSAIAVGNGGAIITSNDGRDVFFQKADGVDATNDWMAVDKLDAANAAVVGTNGRILTTTAASSVPDVVAPAGTITGPARATAGTPTTYTANVSDNAGGSGIDGASFLWSATGIPNATGNPVAVTFPSAGTYVLHVAFKDLAGNSGEATFTVTVGAAPVSGPVSKSLPTGTATLTAPRSCVLTGKRLSAAFKFKRRSGAAGRRARVVKVEFFIDGKRKKTDRRAPFKQKLSTKGLKTGSRHTLRTRVTLRLRGGVTTRTSLTTTFRIC